MADLATLFSQTIPAYQRPEDLDFPVSKIRLFMDILWQTVTEKPLTEEQKKTLKQLIDLLNLLDEHKHESEKELIAAMLPSISPLLEKMPTLGLTGTHVFAHLVPMYQLYLPSLEKQVKDAHSFDLEETLFYYQATIFDHLFLVHIFESEPNVNMIELLLTIKALILTNALVYDYQQHTKGRSISFFTFLMRGGLTSDQLLPFLEETVGKIKEDTKLTVTNQACLATLDFLCGKLLDTAKSLPAEKQVNEQKENQALTETLGSQAPQGQAAQMMSQVTETPVEETAPSAPQSPATEISSIPVTEAPVPTPSPEPTTTEPVVTQAAVPTSVVTTEPVTPEITEPAAMPATPSTSSPLAENPVLTPTPTPAPAALD